MKKKDSGQKGKKKKKKMGVMGWLPPRVQK